MSMRTTPLENGLASSPITWIGLALHYGICLTSIASFKAKSIFCLRYGFQTSKNIGITLEMERLHIFHPASSELPVWVQECTLRKEHSGFFFSFFVNPSMEGICVFRRLDYPVHSLVAWDSVAIEHWCKNLAEYLSSSSKGRIWIWCRLVLGSPKIQSVPLGTTSALEVKQIHMIWEATRSTKHKPCETLKACRDTSAFYTKRDFLPLPTHTVCIRTNHYHTTLTHVPTSLISASVTSGSHWIPEWMSSCPQSSQITPKKPQVLQDGLWVCVNCTFTIGIKQVIGLSYIHC